MTLFTKKLAEAQKQIEAVARRHGLDFYPIVYDILDSYEMAEAVSLDGFPERFGHWKFGEQYFNYLRKILGELNTFYEIVNATNPAIAYLYSHNKFIHQKTVMAHVCGHVDMNKNNVWFAKSDKQMFSTAHSAEQRIEYYREEYGEDEVDDFIYDCMKLDYLIDARVLYRPPAPKKEKNKKQKDIQRIKTDYTYMDSFLNTQDWIDMQRRKLEKEEERERLVRQRLLFPSEPVRDIPAFLSRYAPLEDYQRDILTIQREFQYYVFPMRLTKILHEGWAAYWDNKLMVERGLADSSEIIDLAFQNAGVMSSPGLNPYRLGKMILDDIEYRWNTGRHGMLWKLCRQYVGRDEAWDDFIVFKSIYDATHGKVGERWREWCTFKDACKTGRAKFPKDIYDQKKLVFWWCVYQEAETAQRRLAEEMRTAQEESVKNDIQLDLLLCRALLRIKEAIGTQAIPMKSDPVPEVFVQLARRHSDTVELGKGRDKIFEVRRRANDYFLIYEFFTESLFERYPMVSYKRGGGGVQSDHWGIDKNDFKGVRRKLLLQLFNGNIPIVDIVNARFGGFKEGMEYSGRGLYLVQRHEGADIEIKDLKVVLKVLYKMWKHPVYFEMMVTDEEEHPGIPHDILRDLGVELPEEKTERTGTRVVFYTEDGDEIKVEKLGEVTFKAPY